MSKKKEKDPTFIRQVPRFLQQFAHLLVPDKKNYLGEKVEDSEEDDCRSQVEAEALRQHKQPDTEIGLTAISDIDRPFTTLSSADSDIRLPQLEQQEIEQQDIDAKKIVFKKKRRAENELQEPQKKSPGGEKKRGGGGLSFDVDGEDF